MREAGSEPEQQIQALYRVALSRAPDQGELKSGMSFVQKQRDYHLKLQPASSSEGNSASGVALAALTDLAHVMLNSNEFVYIN